jgi:hypothetical protein
MDTGPAVQLSDGTCPRIMMLERRLLMEMTLQLEVPCRFSIRRRGALSSSSACTTSKSRSMW